MIHAICSGANVSNIKLSDPFVRSSIEYRGLMDLLARQFCTTRACVFLLLITFFMIMPMLSFLFVGEQFAQRIYTHTIQCRRRL